MQEFTVRSVRQDDLESIAEIESVCFPAAEAASRASFKERIAAFPESFLVAEVGGKLVGYINGCATDSPVIYDELFYSTSHHNKTGENLTVFGLAVIPEFRKQGIASQLMKNFVQTAKKLGKKKVILTCKERLIRYYECFGYMNDGISKSSHGGAQWFDMTLGLDT